MKLTIRDDMTVDIRMIAKECGVPKQQALELLVDHKHILESNFGLIRFETEKIKDRGRPEKTAYLTEDQATVLITMFRNRPKVIAFKVALVKAFSDLKRQIAERQSQPLWKDARLDAATSFRLQSRAISDARLNAGKDVKPHHFMTEAKLINWTLKGEFKGINREGLTAFDLSALRELQIANTFYIMKGWSYERRKAELPGELAKFRKKYKRSIQKAAQLELLN